MGWGAVGAGLLAAGWAGAGRLPVSGGWGTEQLWLGCTLVVAAGLFALLWPIAAGCRLGRLVRLLLGLLLLAGCVLAAELLAGLCRLDRAERLMHADQSLIARRQLLRRLRRPAPPVRLRPIRLSEEPPLWRVRGFLTPAECEFLLGSYEWLAAAQFPIFDALMGRVVKSAPVLKRRLGRHRVLARVQRAMLGLVRGQLTVRGPPLLTMQYAKYSEGGKFDLHSDYETGERPMPVTIMLYLRAPEAGGWTVFPRASPRPVRVRPERGTLLVWNNCNGSGAVADAAWHAGEPVLRGHKVILNQFVFTAGTVFADQPDRCSEILPVFPSRRIPLV